MMQGVIPTQESLCLCWLCMWIHPCCCRMREHFRFKTLVFNHHSLSHKIARNYISLLSLATSAARPQVRQYWMPLHVSLWRLNILFTCLHTFPNQEIDLDHNLCVIYWVKQYCLCLSLAHIRLYLQLHKSVHVLGTVLKVLRKSITGKIVAKPAIPLNQTTSFPSSAGPAKSGPAWPCPHSHPGHVWSSSESTGCPPIARDVMFVPA